MYWFWYSSCSLGWPLLLVTAVHACVFPSFLRFDKNQVWLSSWRKDAPGRYNVILLSGQGGRINFYTQHHMCTDGVCRQFGKDKIKSSYRCIKKIGRHKHRYIARSTTTKQPYNDFCLEFVTRDTLMSTPDIKIFYINWDQRPRENSRSVNDGDCEFAPSEYQDVWIPSMAQQRTWWNDCPFHGGYQARMGRGFAKEALCKDERLFRFDVECVSGEGMMWVFPNANCNPFSHALETQFYCYIAWRYSHYTNVILYNITSISQVYTLRYETTDIRTIFDLLTSRRRSFYKANIYYGAVEMKSDTKPPVTRDPREFYNLEYRIGNPQDPDCDDEVINCAERCHETRAYINCKKTCSRPRDECLSNRDNNKCQFKKNYISKWSVQSSNEVEFITHIGDEAIEFFRPDGKKQMSAVCYNEIQCARHSLNDRYIIEVKDMPKGCRRRRLCLELYQGRYIMKNENNGNTLRYRISRSKIANLYTDHNQLCKFQPDPVPLGERYRSKYMKIMVSKDRAEDANRLPDKCGLYRSMRASVQQYPARLCHNVTVNDWSPKECEFHSQLHIDHSACKGRWPENDLVHNYQCISTFYTSHLGLTVSDGDNGNIQLHITRNLKTNDYNCWFYDKTSNPSKLYKFPTADCAIWHQTQYSIIVDESKASVVYTITGTGAQPCDRRKETNNPMTDLEVETVKLAKEVLSLEQREAQYRQHTVPRDSAGLTFSSDLCSRFALTFLFLTWTVVWLL